MSFTNPSGLWLLALGVPILVFHFYRGRLRRIPVPTLLFWEQVLVEEERRTALRRLRHYASLLLNLAALFVLTSAIAEPRVPGWTRDPARYALVLDNTASMATREADGRTRLEHAIDRVRTFAETRGYRDELSMHDLSGTRIPMTADHERFARRLEAPPPARAGDVQERLRQILSAGEDITAIFLTDRPAEGVDTLVKAGRLRVVRVGTPGPNAGWVRGLRVRRPGEKHMLVTVTAAGFAEEEIEREAVALFNGEELERRAVRLPPGEPVDVEWRLDPSRFPGRKIEEGGLLRVVLEPGDAFSLDDEASFVVPPLVPPSVIVFHPGRPDPLLMHAVDTLRAGGVIAQEVGAAPVDQFVSVRSRLEEGWVVIFDRVAPPAPLGRGGYLILGAPGDDRVERPTISDWDREAPPNHLVDYSGLTLRRSRILKGRPLIRSVQGPVATWSSQGGRAVVEIGFALEDSDLGASAHVFLGLLLNFIEWASYEGVRSFATEYAVGEPLRPARPLWVREGDLVYAGSRGEEAVPVRGARPVTAPAAEPGFVQIRAGGRAEWVAANLFDPAESDLREPSEAPESHSLPDPAPWHARIPYAVLAVAAVLALLLLEAWLYHRGVI